MDCEPVRTREQMSKSFPLLKAFKKIKNKTKQQQQNLGIHSNTCLSESISTAAGLSAAQGCPKHSLAQLALLTQSGGYASYNKCCQSMHIKTFLSLSGRQKKGRSSNSPHRYSLYSSKAVDITS